MKHVMTNPTNLKNWPGIFCDANKFICMPQYEHEPMDAHMAAVADIMIIAGGIASI